MCNDVFKMQPSLCLVSTKKYRTVFVGFVDVSAFLEQQFDGVVVLARGPVQRGAARVVGGVDGGAVRQQRAHRAVVANERCQVNGALS